MGLLPLDNFLCWKLKIATLAICIYTIVSAFAAEQEINLVTAINRGVGGFGGFKPPSLRGSSKMRLVRLRPVRLVNV